MDMPVPDQTIIARKAQIVAGLQALLPKNSVLHDVHEVMAYECDAFLAYQCTPLVVVLPSATDEVSAVLRFCHEQHVPVVPRGAGTGLTGGVLPTADCVVLSLSRMNKVLETGYEDRFIHVQAGRANLQVTGAVAEAGFFYAPDPSSQLACAIGGNIGMNSGGAHCLKYGVTTNNLLGVRLVLMDGRIVTLGGPWGQAGDLDLLGVVCGSEGQLGVVTEAWLRILPKPEGALPVLIGFDSTTAAAACVRDIIQSGVLPVAMEFMDRRCTAESEAFAKAGYPICEALLIVEVEGAPDEIRHQLGLIAAVAHRHNPVAVQEAQNSEQAARIWLGRKSAFGSMGDGRDSICLDGVIPVSCLPEVLAKIEELGKNYGLEVANVFHAGDGNIHPTIFYDANMPGQQDLCETLGAEILKLCVAMGGCLTGEHGVGIEKRDLMGVQYNAADLEAQLSIKDVFDPRWLLNPAKVFPLDISAARRAKQGA